MTPEFWHERWRRGEIGWHAPEINVHLQEHWPQLGIGPGERVLVPLCGKSLDLLWLAGQGHRVLGVEISRLAVDAFFAENALRPDVSDEPPFLHYRAAELELLCGDFFDLTADRLQGAQALYDRASLIALPPDMRPRYAEHLQGLLDDQVRILLIILNYDQAQMSGPPFSVDEEEVRDLFASGFRIERLAEQNILAENAQFRQRGLTALTEQVYALESR